MKCSVYILYSVKYKRSYIGISEDIDQRIAEHNRGAVKSTRPYRPWVLVYQESYDSMQLARVREKYLKSAAGRRWRKMNVNTNLGD